MSVLKRFRKAAQQKTGEAPKPKALPTYHGSGGGVRYDDKGNHYWLSESELAELGKLNFEIHDDAEFYAAFAKMRQRLGIKASGTSYASARASVPYTPYKYDGGGGGWTDPTKKKSFMSEWWSGYKSWNSGSSAADTKLAVFRRAIEVTLSVVDDSNKLHMKYSDDNDQPVSYTDMRSNLVVISAKPVNDGLEDGKALDIMSGFAMHEASHSKYTRQLIGQLEKPEPLRPFAIAALMSNLAEDYRIEKLTGSEFPGFADYFQSSLDYMWDVGKKVSGKKNKDGKPMGWPKQYGPDLLSKVNGAIGIVKWEKPFRAEVSGPEWDAEFAWWTTWRDEYNEGKSKLRETTEKALAHLRDAIEEEKTKGKSIPDERAESGESGGASKEMDEQEAKEKAAEKAGQELNDAIRKFLEEHKDELNEFCSHRDHGQDAKVSAGANDAIGQLLDEEVEWIKPDKRESVRSTPPPVIVTKPKETAHSKRYWSASADPLTSKYRAALVFRPDKEIHSTKLLKRGKVDPTQLHRWAIDDWRMFMEKGRKVDPSAYVYLLVDMSGSMSGDKLRSAQRLAKLFITALSSMDGVTPAVFGHTGDLHQTSSDVFRIWEPGDPMSRNGLILSLPHSNNYDGYAIEYVGNKLASDSRNNEQRLLIVLSDGYPAGHQYGGREAENHVREVVDELRRKHRIRTLQIAIDDSMEPERQGRMFDEFIPYKPGDSLDAVPRRLTKWLEKVL